MEISQKVQKIQKSKIILFQLIIIFEFIITILIYLIGKITNFSASYTQLLLFGFVIFVITSRKIEKSCDHYRMTVFIYWVF
ncbi:hypothetical protein MALH04_00440 [Mycoplasma anatis]|nr:hypothetical protein [Mycoplasmopsis anatis]MBW0598202.1 hypothetical protein [Mycoplasmopsis anatis]